MCHIGLAERGLKAPRLGGVWKFCKASWTVLVALRWRRLGSQDEAKNNQKSAKLDNKSSHVRNAVIKSMFLFILLIDGGWRSGAGCVSPWGQFQG